MRHFLFCSFLIQLPIKGLPKRKNTKKQTYINKDNPDILKKNSSEQITRMLLEKAIQSKSTGEKNS